MKCMILGCEEPEVHAGYCQIHLVAKFDHMKAMLRKIKGNARKGLDTEQFGTYAPVMPVQSPYEEVKMDPSAIAPTLSCVHRGSGCSSCSQPDCELRTDEPS